MIRLMELRKTLASLRFWVLVAILIHLLLLWLWRENPFAIELPSTKPEETQIVFELTPPERKPIYPITTPPVEEISELPPAETVIPNPDPALTPTEALPPEQREEAEISPAPPAFEPPPVALPQDFLKKHRQRPGRESPDNPVERQPLPPADQDAPTDGQGTNHQTIGGAAFDVTDFTGFEQYAKHVIENVRQKWYPPYAFTHLGAMGGDCQVTFRIQKDGTISGLQLLDSTGYKALDDPAMRAVEYGAPFLPLPDDFPEKELTVTFTFRYILSEPAQERQRQQQPETLEP